MKFNLHTHTKYCRHASGNIEEYVTRAIDAGLSHLGFSDHVPKRFDDGFERTWKVATGEVESYLGDIRALREKYKDKIEILIGYEAEYYPECHDAFVRDVISYGAEYLILGEHFVSMADERDELVNRHTVLPTDEEEKLKKYSSALSDAMATGLFTYVAHPDIIGFTGDIGIYKKEARKIAEKSLEYDVPLEINLLGIREARAYPRREFWEVVAEVGSPVTIGCDAHRAIDTADLKSEASALDMIRELGLNYIGMPKIRRLTK